MSRRFQEIYKHKLTLTVYLLFSILLFTSCSSSRKAKSPEANKVIETARTFRGTPYRYGGMTRAGMDCSALIYHSYASIGISMPRTADAQSKLGKSVKTNGLQIGDILFFATSKRRKKVTHAGIVTETSRGKIIFIHSSTSLGVTEDNLDNSYWSKAFLYGRRIL